MGAYWLAPIRMTSPASLSGQRRRLSMEEGEQLRHAFGQSHPRLLPLCKLRLFAGAGPDSPFCRADGTVDAVPLDSPGDIELSGPASLTHCGQTFVEQLLRPEEALMLAERLRIAENGSAWSDTIVRWWRQGFGVMLLKEE